MESKVKICKEFNVKMVDNIGGEKIQSSSWLLKKAAEIQKDNEKRI